MSDEETLQSTTSTEETQTTQEAEPQIEETTQDIEPETTEETESEETQPEELDDTESIKKALKDTKAALTKLQQERAEEKRKQAELEAQNSVKAEEQKFQELDATVKQRYNEAVSNITKQKTNDLALLKEAFQNGTAIRYGNTEVEITELNFDTIRESILDYYANEKVQLDNSLLQASEQVKQMKQTKGQELNEQSFKNYVEVKNKERFEKAPEDKMIVEFLKKESNYDEELIKGTFDTLETWYQERVKREKAQEALTKENDKLAGRLQSSATSTTSSSGKYAGIPRSWKEIDKMSIDEYASKQSVILEMDAKGLIKA